MNVIVIDGRFTATPEARRTAGGADLARFRIAHNEGFGDKQKSMFINVTVFGEAAKRVCLYGKKGNRVQIKGRLDISYYTKDGEEKESLSIIADYIEYIDRPEKPAEPAERKEKPQYEDVYISDEELPF